MASLDLGTLSYTLKVNGDSFSSGINSAKGNMSSLDSAIKENNSTIDSNKAKMNELSEELKKAGSSLSEIKAKFGEDSAQYKETESSISELSNRYMSLENENKRLVTSNDEMKSSYSSIKLDEFKNTLSGVGNEYKTLEEGNEKLSSSNRQMEDSYSPAKVNEFKNAINETSTAVDNTGKHTEELGNKGGKVKDILTGAFRTVKDAVVNTAMPIVAGMGLQELIQKSEDGQKSLGQLDNVLKSTGDASGMTKQQLLNLAQSQSQVTEYSKGANIATENLLLTFTNLKSDVFPGALKAVNDMSTAMGQDTKSSAIELGKALNNPTTGLTALTRVGVTFTEGQKQQIAAMQKAGDTAGAQKLILAELNKEVGGSAEAAGKTFPGQLKILDNQLITMGASITGQLIGPLSQLSSVINANMGKIQSVVSSVVAGIITTFKTLSPVVLGIGQDILKIATNIFPQLNSSSGNLGKTLLDLAKNGLTAVKNVLDWIAQHGEAVKFALIGIGSAFAAIKITELIKNIKTGIGLIKDVSTGISLLRENGVSTFNIIKMVFGLNPMTLGIGLGIAALAIAAYEIITHWTQVRTFFIGLWNGIKTGVIGLGNSIKNTWNSIRTTTLAVWNGIKSSVMAVWNSLKTGASTVFNGIKTVVVTIWNAIKTAIITVITPIASTVISIFTSMSTGISTIFTGIQTFFTGVWQAIKAIFGGALLLLTDLVTGNFTKLSSDAQLIWNDLKTAFGNIWNGIQQIFSGSVQAISAFLSGAWNAIKSLIESIWNGIKSFFESTWNGIVNTAKGIWNGFKSFFAELWEGIKAIINGVPAAFENVGNTIVNAWNTVVNFFASLPGKFVNFVKGVGEAIVHGFDSAINFVKSLPSKFLEWGKDMIKGLINGIKSMIGDVGSAVSSVGNKIRSILHFSVPDEGPLTDYESWMPDFMTGLANGIDSNKFKVTDSIKALAKDMKINTTANITANANATKVNSDIYKSNITKQPKPITLNLVLSDGSKLASYLIDDINKLQGTIQLKTNRIMAGRR